MGALLVSASSQFIENNSPPTLTVPMTVGMWINPNTLGGTLYQLAAGGSATANGEGWDIKLTGAGIFSIGTAGGGSRNSASLTAAATANTWTFVIARWIAANSRRISAVFPSGATDNASSTSSNTPPGPITREALGCTDNSVRAGFFDGTIAEFWQTNTDIQPDGLALNDDLLRKLAYEGPFSVPHIAQDIIDYRSLRSAMGSDQDTVNDYYMGSKGRQIWTNTGAIQSIQPPVASRYIRPNDNNLLTPNWFRAYPDAGGGGGGAVTKFQSYFIG